MKISIFQLLLLAVFGALAVAGILIFAFAVGGGSATNTVGNVVIWGTLDKASFDGAMHDIVQDDQTLSGVSYVQKDASTFDQTLASAIAENRGPDLYIISSDDALLNQGRVSQIPYAQISEKNFKDTFVDAADPFLGANGIIAVPFMVDPLVLYWNRDLLAGGGYAQPPIAWDQVPALAEAISVKDTSGSIRTSAIALGTYRNIENAEPILSMLFMQAANVGSAVPDPITGKNSQGDLVSLLGSSFGRTAPPAVDALRFYTEFADAAKADYSWNDSFSSARNAFAQGQVALYVGFASENALIHSINPNLNYSAAVVPQLTGIVRPVTFGRSYAFAVPLQSKNSSGAFLAAEKLDTASTTLAFANAYGMASAKRLALSVPVSGDQLAINRMALIAWNWSDPDPAQTSMIFSDMVESVDSGAKSLGDAVSLADQRLLHILQK